MTLNVNLSSAQKYAKKNHAKINKWKIDIINNAVHLEHYGTHF